MNVLKIINVDVGGGGGFSVNQELLRRWVRRFGQVSIHL
jgi:hypothetical protein